ncbi:hypothetical protein JD844_016212 [Phrynosoma platyrhinos]|uniref:PLAT domain-containing protein n=1 Tax=Phrynosoma platyrhinos TaxID=52577 RepID=A0ABQ7SK97_PHRPL|nr:hypothetical protein JD844_016212 [Phrynosoma platyrhinos]
MVTIKKSENSDKEWLFPCWNWLDTHLGICDTVCEIETVGKKRTSCSIHPEINRETSGLWIIDIIGSDLSAKTDPIHLTFNFYGDQNIKKLTLQLSETQTHIKCSVLKRVGMLLTVFPLLTQDELKNIGSLYKIQISGSHNQINEPWHLDMLHMKHTGTNEEMWLNFDSWFKPNEEKCVELPVFYSNQDPFPVVEYSIHVYTGDKKKADASGDVYLCLQGERSDCGKRWLNNSERGPISFGRGEMNSDILFIFLLDDWFLEKIVVKEGSYPFTSYTFVHNNWISKHLNKGFTEIAIPLQGNTSD